MRRARSLASDPELTKKTVFNSCGNVEVSLSANRTKLSCKKRLLVFKMAF